MEINANFNERAVVHAGEMAWSPSPMPGVDRLMLDRVGDEVAQATTIVRYAPGSSFSSHKHTGGEEFLVLDGVFQDEHGDFPVGSYVRNPPETSHTPRSKKGCVIFVKLWQFDPDDRYQMTVDTRSPDFQIDPARKSVHVLPLYRDARETVRMERWEPGADLTLSASGGTEVLVTQGGFQADGETFEPWSWVRLPEGDKLQLNVAATGALVWMKSGHLTHGSVGP